MQEAMFALHEHGSANAASKALDIPRSTLRHRIRNARLLNIGPYGPLDDSDIANDISLARKGYAEGHFENGVAPGYLMGKVTIHRDADGNIKNTWERQSPDTEARERMLEVLRDSLSKDIQPLPEIKKPKYVDDNLLTVVPMGDPHFGMFSWAKETGENFDLKIAEEVTYAAVDSLTARSPASKTAMLLNLGDYFHANDRTNATPRSGANLDVDGRFQKIATIGVLAMQRCIIRMLEKHETVIVRNNGGNHDPDAHAMITIAIASRFHDNPRVIVETSPSPFYYYLWGNTLIGSTHGDGAKLPDLPMIMANDRKHFWAASIWRVWHVGHFHHNQKLVQKDLVGCEVETHRTLAATDAWHHHSGYRSYKDMKGIVYDKEEGEIMRFRSGRV